MPPVPGIWYKIVGFLQQNWAVIEKTSHGATVLFVHDAGGIFERLSFSDETEAISALRRNEFLLFGEDLSIKEFLAPPSPPFEDDPGAANYGVYSSGRFWIAR